jgi:hypothetical protein
VPAALGFSFLIHIKRTRNIYISTSIIGVFCSCQALPAVPAALGFSFLVLSKISTAWCREFFVPSPADAAAELRAAAAFAEAGLCTCE